MSKEVPVEEEEPDEAAGTDEDDAEEGTEDEVVPPNQAVVMYEATKDKGIPTALVMFEGEQHGFRGSNAIRRAIEGELHFYGAILGFKAPMSPDLEGYEIANLK